MGTYIAAGKQVLFDDGANGSRHIADAAGTEEAHFLATMANAPKGEDGGPIVMNLSVDTAEVRKLIEEHSFDYMVEADKTCSIIFQPENVDRDAFVALLERIVADSRLMNLAKKLLFRGKMPHEMGTSQPSKSESLLVEFGPSSHTNGDIDILHGIIGVITEAGEMAEQLLHRLKTGYFEPANVNEEVGDVSWYLVRQLRGIGLTLEQSQRVNIEKLHGRHGDSFNVFRDANRDLAREHAFLEKAIQPAPLFEHEISRLEGEGGPAIDSSIERQFLADITPPRDPLDAPTPPRMEEAANRQRGEWAQGMIPLRQQPDAASAPPQVSAPFGADALRTRVPGLLPEDTAPNVGTRPGPCGDIPGMDC
jgi:NTP pyrophosphatase (non-canonical NTP hydrolase)